MACHFFKINKEAIIDILRAFTRPLMGWAEKGWSQGVVQSRGGGEVKTPIPALCPALSPLWPPPGAESLGTGRGGGGRLVT